MSAQIDDGGPAFPTGERLDQNRAVEQYRVSGMTLRDWFAGKTLGAMLSIPEVFVRLGTHELISEDIAGSCYEWADAMLAARDGKESA